MKKSKFLVSLGVNKLNHDFLQFTTVHLIFMAATAITTTYINTLLMRVSTDANAAFKYDIIFYAFTAIGMLLATFIMKKFSNKTILIIGAVFYMLVYGLTLVFVSQIDSIYGFISALHGVGCGFYWIEVSRATVSYTTDDTREVAMAYMGVFVGAVGLIVPLITGIVIDITPGLYGYFIVFGLCFLLCLLTVFFVLKLRALPAKNKKTKL
ncbi:MAG: MFS transporter, partial [Oscillospiraceae bacterium]